MEQTSRSQPSARLQRVASSLKTEAPTTCRQEWTEITELEDHPYDRRHHAEQMALDAVQEGVYTSHPENTKVDQSVVFPIPLLQGHNRSFNSSRKPDSTAFPWTQWVEDFQPKQDHLLKLSLPSLSSSGISSIRSNMKDICPTPDEGVDRGPLVRNIARPYSTFLSSASGKDQSMSTNSENDYFRITSQDDATRKSPLSFHNAENNEKVNHLVHWDPTDLPCGYCKERYSLESDLQLHLITHKRYRNYLKRQRKTKLLAFDCESSVDSSNSIAPSGPSPDVKQHTVSNHTNELSPNEPVTLDDILYHNTQHQAPSDQPFAALQRLQISDSFGHQPTATSTSSPNKVADERIGSSGLPSEKSEPPVRDTPASTSSTKTVISSALFPCSGHSCIIDSASGPVDSVVSSHGDKPSDPVSSSGSLREYPEPQIFHLEMEAVSKDSDVPSHGLMESIILLMGQNLVSCIMNEFGNILKRGSIDNLRSRGTVSEPTRNDATQSSPSVSRTSSQFSSHRGRNREDDECQDPGDGDDDDHPRAPKRPRTSSPLMKVSLNNLKFACPYRKYDPRTYCVRNWRPCALTGLDSVARVKSVVHPLFSPNSD
jgi:hypothetical protein